MALPLRPVGHIAETGEIVYECDGCGVRGWNLALMECHVVVCHPDPDDHPYIGDGTSSCAVCQYPMNAHLPERKPL